MKLHYVLKESCFARCHHCSLEGLSKSFPLEPCDPNHFRGLWMLHVTCTSWDRSSFVCTHCSHRRIVVWDSPHYSFHFLSFSSQISASLALPPTYSIVREERMNPRPLMQMNPFKVYFKGFIYVLPQELSLHTLIPSVSIYWDLHILHCIIKNS